jgi:tRNA pseudouridine55 synthase
MARGKSSRYDAVDGLLLLNKPPGMTSNRALQTVRRLLNARKAGHTGSLDPSATGMLPLCFGEATKVCAFLLDADKTYRVTARLGTATDTGDADGSETVATAAVPELSFDAWNDVLQEFLGESMQVPPMYSALKKDGKRLYELARKGEIVEREPRKIRIDEIRLLEAAGTRLVFRVTLRILRKGPERLRIRSGSTESRSATSGLRTCLIWPPSRPASMRTVTVSGPACSAPTWP